MHTRGVAAEYIDPAQSGAEWWVQRREVSCGGSGGENYAAAAKPEATDIPFHWDKDEKLRSESGWARRLW